MDVTGPAYGYALSMLDYARQRAREALIASHTAVLVTSGTAGIQASEVPCQAVDLVLYLLVPQTSDHLFNLEQSTNVTLLSSDWELKGQAHVLSAGAQSPEPELLRQYNAFRQPGSEWCAVIRVEPTRMQIRRAGGWGNIETIDLEPEDGASN